MIRSAENITDINIQVSLLSEFIESFLIDRMEWQKEENKDCVNDVNAQRSFPIV